MLILASIPPTHFVDEDCYRVGPIYKQHLVDMLEVLSAKKINKYQITLTPFILIIKNQTPNKKHMSTLKSIN